MNERRITLKETNAEKDLRVWMDNKLTFKDHILVTAKRANMMLGIIRRTFKSLDARILPPLYKTLVRSILEYGNTAWCPQFQNEAWELEKVQKRATKMIPELKDKCYSDRLRILNLPTLAFRQLRGDMINTYKYAKGMYNSDLLKFETEHRTSTRCHSYKLSKTRCKTAKYQNFYRNRITNAWNGLPTRVVDAETVNQFKNRIDAHWKHHPLRYNPRAGVKTMPDHRTGPYPDHNGEEKV